VTPTAVLALAALVVFIALFLVTGVYLVAQMF
jgi:hypothetical protein